MTKRGGLVVVPDDASDDEDDAPLDPTHADITDTDLTFVGALAPLAIDGKTSALKVTFLINPENPISHRDFAVLRHRFLRVNVTAVNRAGVATNPSVDPVAAAVQAKRIDRMLDGWVEGGTDEPPEHP